MGSGSHAEQTARVMLAYEPVAMAERPAVTVVVGDVNSTAAVALVCAKLGLRTVHLEGGCVASTGACRRKSTGS